MTATHSTSTPPTEYLVPNRELVEMLIRHFGKSEGHWALAVQFAMGGANTGPTDQEVFPTAIVAVTALGIFEVPSDFPGAVAAAPSVVAVKKARRTSPKARPAT
jgi:hypothetical protein